MVESVLPKHLARVRFPYLAPTCKVRRKKGTFRMTIGSVTRGDVANWSGWVSVSN